jgi:thioredoxin-related protein
MKTFLVSTFLIFVGNIVHSIPVGDDGLHKPNWLQVTFKNMHDDLADASAVNKRFFVIFEQRGCIYCKKMHENVFSDTLVLELLNNNFFAVQMNLFGDEEVTDFDGENLSEKEMAKKWGIVFTPTILFFPEENTSNSSADKIAVLNMPGAFSKYTTINLLNFISEKRYEKDEHFQKYHARKLIEQKSN